MEGSDDVFVIHNTEDGEALTEDVPEARPLENSKEAEAEAMEQVKGLIPLCTQHVRGPQLSNATFGYDIAQMAKRPWAEPGAKLSDYFNYGFNEQSWRVYCAMQKNGEESLLAKATEMLQKLEAAGRPAGAAAAGGGEDGMMMPHATGEGPMGGGDPSGNGMMMMAPGMYPYPHGGSGMEGYGGANPYDENTMHGRGGYGNNRPYPQRDFHSGGGGGGGYHGNNTADGRGPNFNYKTRLCKSFAEGHCNRGDSCNYAHGVEELRQPGGANANLGGGNNVPPQQQQQQQQQQQPSGQNFAQPNFYGGGAAPQPAERTTNYLMPPSQANGGGGAVPPMMQPSTMMAAQDGEGASGFRQPPKRQRHEGGGNVYERQY